MTERTRVEAVMRITNVHWTEAVTTLRKHDGDCVKAVMDLLDRLLLTQRTLDLLDWWEGSSRQQRETLDLLQDLEDAVAGL